VKDSSAKPLILAFDDEAKCRETLSELLAREGYEVACAENGHDALDYLNRSLPSLIILDLMMPVMSGWEFRKQQLSDPRLKSLPLVITSANALAHKIDADAVVHKPIDFAVLMSVVRKNCRTNPLFQSKARPRSPAG
jgi:CheY-like chemotaxis protein